MHRPDGEVFRQPILAVNEHHAPRSLVFEVQPRNPHAAATLEDEGARAPHSPPRQRHAGGIGRRQCAGRGGKTQMVRRRWQKGRGNRARSRGAVNYCRWSRISCGTSARAICPRFSQTVNQAVAADFHVGHADKIQQGRSPIALDALPARVNRRIVRRVGCPLQHAVLFDRS
jgi:hypothetical protein